MVFSKDDHLSMGVLTLIPTLLAYLRQLSYLIPTTSYQRPPPIHHYLPKPHFITCSLDVGPYIGGGVCRLILTLSETTFSNLILGSFWGVGGPANFGGVFQGGKSRVHSEIAVTVCRNPKSEGKIQAPSSTHPSGRNFNPHGD